jgi:hypothetical protein
VSKRDYHTSYELEKLLSASIDRITDNVTRQHKLKREIVKLRRERKRVQGVPDEVKKWFEETDGLEEEEEGE